MPPSRKRLTLCEVDQLIDHLLCDVENFNKNSLLFFAEKINGAPFEVSVQEKRKSISMLTMKKAVLKKFGCTSVTTLRKNKTFAMAFVGEKVSLRSAEDWRKQYRRWVAVPEDERNQTGPTCINGIDVMENFRPWHVFGLDANSATTEDIKESFRKLAKIHHPDRGGIRLFLSGFKKCVNLFWLS